MREHVAGRWAALAVAALVVLAGGGVTHASWTAAGVAAGASIHTGRVDLRLDGQDALTGLAPFSLSGLEPGGSVARVVTVSNAGTVPVTWSASLDATGADALLTALTTRLTDAGSTDGSSCGGTTLAGPATLAPGGTSPVCVAVALPASASPDAAGATGQLTLRATGRTVRGDWPDTATAVGSGIATAALTPPVIRCAAQSLGQSAIAWDPVPGATGYRVESASLLGGASELTPATTGFTFTGLAGTVTVVAEFGSATWVSAASNTLTFSALSGVLGTCG